MKRLDEKTDLAKEEDLLEGEEKELKETKQGEKSKVEKLEEEKKKHRKKLDEIKIEKEDIDPKYEIFVEIIGIDGYRRLVEYLGGQYTYVPKYEKVIEKKKREYVFKVFLENDSNYSRTAIVCGLSISTVRKYVKEHRRELAEKRRKGSKK